MNEQNLINLDEFAMSEEELFSHVDNDSLASEKITAPRYSYWQSVFRVFFRGFLIHTGSLFRVFRGFNHVVYCFLVYSV